MVRFYRIRHTLVVYTETKLNFPKAPSLTSSQCMKEPRRSPEEGTPALNPACHNTGLPCSVSTGAVVA